MAAPGAACSTTSRERSLSHSSQVLGQKKSSGFAWHKRFVCSSTSHRSLEGSSTSSQKNTALAGMPSTHQGLVAAEEPTVKNTVPAKEWFSATSSQGTEVSWLVR